jgi:adenylate cyclase
VRTYDLSEAAERSGVGTGELTRLVELGVITPAQDGRFSPGDLRRVGLVTALAAAGIPLEGLGQAIRDGQLSLGFLDAPAFERFSTLSGDSFQAVAARTGLPVDVLLSVREAAGSMAPAPTDHIRHDEVPFVALLELMTSAGYRPAAIQQLIRAQGDAMRRIAETESAVWMSEVVAPAAAAGKRPDEVLGADFGDRMSVLTEQAVMAMYHLQQTRAWTSDLIVELESMLADAGLHSRLDHPPAMCFLDISGYTKLTQERGDAAAAQLAEQLGRLVQRRSIEHGGRPVKWLGDGVMIHFPSPGRGVAAALEMVRDVVAAGLPPAHVGLHAGPVIFQEGDYYGQTVNVAARIASVAQAGQVLVSQAVIDASDRTDVAFRGIGPVGLKGVAEAMHLFTAHRPG